MKIGLLSDTHGFLDPRIADYFAACDEIWHAGDIGDLHVIDALEVLKPVRAVFGNIDDVNARAKFPEDLRFQCEGLDIWMTHIAGTPPGYNPRIKRELKKRPPNILICGHSHILRVKRDPLNDNMLFINPGAAGNHGFHKTKTIMRFDLENGAVTKMEVIELGRRGALN